MSTTDDMTLGDDLRAWVRHGQSVPSDVTTYDREIVHAEILTFATQADALTTALREARDLLVTMGEAGDRQHARVERAEADVERLRAERGRTHALLTRAESDAERAEAEVGYRSSALAREQWRGDLLEVENSRLTEQVEQFREALRAQTEETRRAATAGPSHLTRLQLDAVVAERDRLATQVAGVLEALDTTEDPSATSAEVLADVRAALKKEE